VRPLPVVHVITDDEILRSPDFLARAEDVLSALGPRGALHLRGHRTSARVLYDCAVALVARTPWLVINDRVDIALAVGAHAVQVGKRSFRVEDVRRVAPGMKVGESVHDVARTGADWVMAGHVFETPSHSGEEPRGIDFVRRVVQQVAVPVIAVGGVKVSDVEALQRAGAYGVAIIRGIWHTEDSAQAAREYLYFFS
jgi:thiazole tautomerase (transcriptional regulator TenI)